MARNALRRLALISLVTCGLSGNRTGASAREPAAPQAGYLVFAHNRLELVEPSYVPDASDRAETLQCDLARGEFEPLQIGLYGLAETVNNLRIEVAADLPVRIFRGQVSTTLRSQPHPGMDSPVLSGRIERHSVAGEGKQPPVLARFSRARRYGRRPSPRSYHHHRRPPRCDPAIGHHHRPATTGSTLHSAAGTHSFLGLFLRELGARAATRIRHLRRVVGAYLS